MFKTTWKHLRRTPYQSLAASLVMATSLFIASLFIITAFLSQKVLNFFETRPQVIAYLKDEANPNQIEALKEKLQNTGKVKDIKYISKEEALTIYREQNKDDPLLLEMVTAKILPASIEFSATDINLLSDLANTLKNEEIVSQDERGNKEIEMPKDIVESLTTFTASIRKAGLILIGFLALQAFIVVLVVTSIKISQRKDEIEILRLIGASNQYIRAPFLLEGFFYGIVGSFLAWSLSYLLLLYTTPFLIDFFSGIPVLPIPLPFMASLLLAETLFGALIGLLGSYLSVRRYLRI
jgi:cell division transport system permease protein